MPLNTTYQLRLIQTYGVAGKTMENVFFYNHTAGLGVAIDLAQVFENVMLPLINTMQTATIQNSLIKVINLGDLGDFIDYPLTGGGNVSDDTMPPYVAVGYSLKVNTRAVRQGSKRIGGIPEGVVSYGVIDNAPYIVKVNTLKTALQEELSDVSDTYLPIVIKRVKEPVVGTVPLQYTYRLPINDTEFVFGEIVTALTSLNVTHQVSREL